MVKGSRNNNFLTGLLALLPALLPATAWGEALRDPTRAPDAYTAVPTTEDGEKGFEWRLTATYTSRDRRHAMINGRLVREGETVNDAQVISIRPGRVKLREGEEVFSLTLYTDTIRRPAVGYLRS